MERLTNSIADKIASELQLNNDNKEVIAYGMFAILHMFLSIILIIIFGMLFHVVFEALIISFTASILRKYSGGAHASRPGICTIVGTVISVGQAVVITFIISPLVNLKLNILIAFVSFIWSYYMVYRLAPIDSPAKPIRKQEKKDRMKKRSILILSAYLVMIVLSGAFYSYIKEKGIITLSLCILGGMTWQVFTLTEAGHLVLGKIDTFFNHISIILRRGEE